MTVAATSKTTGETTAPGPARTGPRRFVVKKMSAGRQHSLPGRYAAWVPALSLLAFAWAFLGWLNETYLLLWDNPIWLNRYTEYAIILAFGLWRIRAEHNPYTRRRLSVLVACVTVLWWLIPWLLPFFEPALGYLGTQPVFPSLHTPGTLSFYLVLMAVLLFGRRVVCGWNCPCVGIREVVGFPFRHRTPRGRWAWRLRHAKWLFFVLYLGAILVLLFPPNEWSVSYVGAFALIVVLPYFASMLLSPVIGNRGYCRYLCPFGATFGLLNRLGFFRIDYDAASCTDCGTCKQVCDMGIPVVDLGRARGRIDVADCMGCGRCVSECPAGSLAFRDARDLFMAPMRRDRVRLRAWALGRVPGSRRQMAALAVLLAIAVAASWWLHGAIGSRFELIALGWEALCRVY